MYVRCFTPEGHSGITRIEFRNEEDGQSVNALVFPNELIDNMIELLMARKLSLEDPRAVS